MAMKNTVSIGFDPRSSIVKRVFGCRLSNVILFPEDLGVLCFVLFFWCCFFFVFLFFFSFSFLDTYDPDHFIFT